MYIAKAPGLAKPILTKIREAAHGACPNCEETLKSGHPTVMHHGMLCGMKRIAQAVEWMAAGKPRNWKYM